MIKIAVAAVLGIHGLIHLMGFAKGFGLAEVEALSLPISRGWGAVWAAAGVGVVAAVIAWLAHAGWWWMLGAPALIASQVAIIAFWSDARFGTIGSVVLLIAVVLGFGAWRFAGRAEAAIERLTAGAPAIAPVAVSPGDLEELPAPVRRWLEGAGVVGRVRDRTVFITQRGEMQTSRGGRWMRFRAEQWVAVAGSPGFVWVADVDGPLGVTIAGLDQYVADEGATRIELLSLIPVVDERGPTIDQGALVRYLAEMIWYPSAALGPDVSWEAIDASSARATLRRGELEVAGVFRFDDRGRAVGFEARRYRDDQLRDWVIDNDPASFRELAGVLVPTRSTVSWVDGGDEPWTWLRLEIATLRRIGGT